MGIFSWSVSSCWDVQSGAKRNKREMMKIWHLHLFYTDIDVSLLSLVARSTCVMYDRVNSLSLFLSEHKVWHVSQVFKTVLLTSLVLMALMIETLTFVHIFHHVTFYIYVLFLHVYIFFVQTSLQQNCWFYSHTTDTYSSFKNLRSTTILDYDCFSYCQQILTSTQKCQYHSLKILHQVEARNQQNVLYILKVQKAGNNESASAWCFFFCLSVRRNMIIHCIVLCPCASPWALLLVLCVSTETLETGVKFPAQQSRFWVWTTELSVFYCSSDFNGACSDHSEWKNNYQISSIPLTSIFRLRISFNLLRIEAELL